MTPTQQQMARDLATVVMGWKCKGEFLGGYLFERLSVADCVVVGVKHINYYICWNPFTSRDDAHELLGRLTDEQWRKFDMHLVAIAVAEKPDGQTIRTLIQLALTASPAQVAEAVWRATCQ